MAMEDVAVQKILTTKWFYLPVLFSVTIYCISRKYYNSLYAYALSKMDQTLSKSGHLNDIKGSLFSSMMPNKAIVEIGAGSGTNFQFYPQQCSVTCVEPKVEFEGYVNESIKKKAEHLKIIEFAQGDAEHLSEIGSVLPNSIDYVVCTLVLCSVKDVGKVISEIKKVLKPNGKFYFLEHVLATEPHQGIRLLQHLITPPAKLLLDNCHHNREPWIAIEAAGFSSVTYQRKSLAKTRMLSPMHWLCVGTATK